MKFVPKEKLGKKAKRALDRARRATWGGMNPVTRKAENKKAYKRKKPSSWYTDDSMGALLIVLPAGTITQAGYARPEAYAARC